MHARVLDAGLASRETAACQQHSECEARARGPRASSSRRVRSTRSTRRLRGDFAPGAGAVSVRRPAGWPRCGVAWRRVRGAGGGAPHCETRVASGQVSAGGDAAPTGVSAPRRGGPRGGGRAGAAAAGGARQRGRAAGGGRRPDAADRRHELDCLARRGPPRAPHCDFAEPRELERPPPRAPRRDSAAGSPEIGLRRGNSPVRAVGGVRRVSRTTGHTAGPIGGPTGGPTTRRASGRTTGPTDGHTTGGHPWGRAAAPAAAYRAAAGGAGEAPIEDHAGRS